MKITEYVFENGLKIIYQKRSDPITAVSIFCRVGSIHEPLNLNKSINLNGVSHMIEHMMFKGTKNIKDTEGIAKIFDSIGAYFNAYTDKNTTCYTVKSSSKHINIIIETLSDMLMNSLFLEKEFEMEKKVVVEEIIRARDNTANYINNEIYSLYFKGNNLANPIGGLPEDILKYDYKESKKYLETFYKPDNMVISICSDVEFNTLKNIIEMSYLVRNNSKPFKNLIYTNTSPIIKQDKIRAKAIDRQLEQTHLAVGFRTTDMYNSDIYILDILRIILSGNMSSRLFTNLREKRGLTYSVSIDASEYEQYGHFTILTSVDKRKVLDYSDKGVKKQGALTVIRDTLQELINNGITDSELSKAKGYIQGKLTLATEDALHLSDYNGKIIVFDKKYFVPIQDLYEIHYSLLTKESVNKIIHKYFKKDRLCMYLIGDKANSILSQSVKIFEKLK